MGLQPPLFFMTQEFLKAKKDLLISKGWIEILPEFNLDYFLESNMEDNFKNIGYYISAVTGAMGSNPFAILSEDSHDAYIKLLKSVSPIVNMPQPPVVVPCINATWPFNPQYWNNTEAAFEELTYRVIKKIVEELGTPNEIYQSIAFNAGDDDLMFKLDPSLYDLRTITVAGKLILVFDDTFVSIQLKNTWSDNGVMPAHEWQLYSDNIRGLTNEIIHEMGLELNPKTYQLGLVDPEYKLNSFPDYIQDQTNDLYYKMGFNKGEYPERFNIIIEGPPGYGKTRWTHSYTAEVLASKGYLIILADYSTLQDIIIPDYIDKVCLVINDADTLALDRDESEQGNTEQILAWLDGSRSSFIKPFYLEKRTSIVTIMTANSTKKWDEAALRQGRIHGHYYFDKVKLCELTTEES